MEEQQKENKAVTPAANKGRTVKVRINLKRAIANVGKAGDVVEMGTKPPRSNTNAMGCDHPQIRR